MSATVIGTLGKMARWEPDSPKRLQAAALELFAERGFERTTVAEIAERAGVTERTFFRHFEDKREVLFARSEVLVDAMAGAVAAAPPEATPIEAVGAALAAAAELLDADRARARRRHAVIAANVELLERELAKMATLAAALAAALRQRGVAGSRATVAAEAGVTAFRIGFERWVTDGEATLPAVLDAVLTELRAVVGEG